MHNCTCLKIHGGGLRFFPKSLGKVVLLSGPNRPEVPLFWVSIVFLQVFFLFPGGVLCCTPLPLDPPLCIYDSPKALVMNQSFAIFYQ